MIIPTVIEKGYPSDHAYDLYSLLLKERIIFCTRPIDDALASIITAQLLYLDSINHQTIQLYINSPGGSVSAGFAILDTMNFIQSDVSTIGMGMIASMASILLMCGTKGKRCCLENATVMIHQPLGNMEGKVSDLENTAKHFMEMKKQVIQIMHKATSLDSETIKNDIENDRYLSSKQALEYGIIDRIITQKENQKV